jgi:hypothetical protein
MHDGSDAVNDLVVDGDLLNVHGGDWSEPRFGDRLTPNYLLHNCLNLNSEFHKSYFLLLMRSLLVRPELESSFSKGFW